MKHIDLSLCISLIVLLPSCTTVKEAPEQTKETVEYITKDITVQHGTTFTVQLPSNRTTGFSWKIESLDTEYLSVLDHSYEKMDTDDQRLGVGGAEVWKLQALKQGTTKIELSYRQQWRTDAHGKHATITITIT